MICKHEDFVAHVRVNRFEDSGRFLAEITVKCRQCEKPFQFLGLQPGLALQGAACSIDALEARIAIAPEGSIPSPLQQMTVGARRFDS